MTNSAYYDDYDYRGFWDNRKYEWLADKLAIERLLEKVDAKRERLIDVGAGFGRNTPCYASRWKSAFLFDPSNKILAEARKNTKEFTNLKFVKGSAAKLPFPKSFFDTVVCVRVFHHIPDPEIVIKEFARVTMKGGFLLLEVANKRHMKALVRSFLAGKVDSYLSYSSVDLGRAKNKDQTKTIAFVNHHPEVIKSMLIKNGYVIKDCLSVSNLRGIPFLRLMPMSLILLKERLLQRPLARVLFGPSIYYLAKKL